MIRTHEIIFDIFENIVNGEKKYLHYDFPNRTRLEIVGRNGGLEIYFCGEARNNGYGHFLNKNNISRENIDEILQHVLRGFEDKRKRMLSILDKKVDGKNRLRDNFYTFDRGTKKQEVIDYINKVYLAS